MKELQIIIFTKEHVRSWVYSGVVKQLAKEFKVVLKINHKLYDTVTAADQYLGDGIEIQSYTYDSEESVDVRIQQLIQVLMFKQKGYRYLLKMYLFNYKPGYYLLYFKNLYRILKYRRNIIKFISLNKPRTRARYELETLVKALPKLSNFDIRDDQEIIVVLGKTNSESLAITSMLDQMGAKYSIAISNWDNLASGFMLESRYSKMLVWGSQMQKQAQTIHSVDPRKIFRVGSPRLPTNEEIDNFRIGIQNFKKSKKSILYLGYSLPSGEVDKVSRIFKSIKDSGLAEEADFIYRPHPNPFNEEDKLKRLGLPNEIIIREAVIVAQDLDWPIADATFFQDLLRADLVISTPTTMILEAMAAGCKIVLDDTKSYRYLGSSSNSFRNYSWFDEIYSSRLPRFRSLRGSGKFLANELQKPTGFNFPLESILEYDSMSFAERVILVLKS